MALVKIERKTDKQQGKQTCAELRKNVKRILKTMLAEKIECIKIAY